MRASKQTTTSKNVLPRPCEPTVNIATCWIPHDPTLPDAVLVGLDGDERRGVRVNLLYRKCLLEQGKKEAAT